MSVRCPYVPQSYRIVAQHCTRFPTIVQSVSQLARAVENNTKLNEVGTNLLQIVASCAISPLNLGSFDHFVDYWMHFVSILTWDRKHVELGQVSKIAGYLTDTL